MKFVFKQDALPVWLHDTTPQPVKVFDTRFSPTHGTAAVNQVGVFADLDTAKAWVKAQGGAVVTENWHFTVKGGRING